MNDQQTGNFKDVSRYKLEQAKDDLDTAQILLELGKLRAANILPAKKKPRSRRRLRS